MLVLTTHYMDEADLLCDRIAIIDHGKIIAMDTGEALKDTLGGDIISIETDCSEKLGKLVKKLKWVKDAKRHNGKIALRVEKGERKIPELMNIAKESEIKVKSVSLHRPTLDDVFLHYTGRTIREEEASAKDRMRLRVNARRRTR